MTWLEIASLTIVLALGVLLGLMLSRLGRVLSALDAIVLHSASNAAQRAILESRFVVTQNGENVVNVTLEGLYYIAKFSAGMAGPLFEPELFSRHGTPVLVRVIPAKLEDL